jgi:ABC-2 type transport system ATP-binding protein
LSDRKNVRVKELSGGLARRAELAKTLLAKPMILLLDEPTTGLDPSSRIEFWNELRELRDQGMTILVTTHLMDEADLCDELIFMVDGRCAATGSPRALKEALKEDIITLEIEEDKIADGDVMGRIRLAQDPRDVMDQDGNRIRISTTNSTHWIKELAPLLGQGLKSLNWGKANLADVYLQKTGRKL